MTSATKESQLKYKGSMSFYGCNLARWAHNRRYGPDLGIDVTGWVVFWVLFCSRVANKISRSLLWGRVEFALVKIKTCTLKVLDEKW